MQFSETWWYVLGCQPIRWHNSTNLLQHIYTVIQNDLYVYWRHVSVRLIHLPLVPHITVTELCRHWFRYWLGAEQVPSHFLNQCWFIVNWALGNKLQWKFNQNTNIFIRENASENIRLRNGGHLVHWGWGWLNISVRRTDLARFQQTYSL